MKPICELGLFSLSRSFRNCTLNHWRLRWFYKYNTYDTYYIIYAYIYICHISFPNLQSFWHLTPSYKIDVYIYIYMYTQCLYVSMQEVVIDISPKGSKIKNGLCKKNIVKSFPTFLGSRKSRLPLFRVSCFWRLQNQKKTRWYKLYKSRCFVSMNIWCFPFFLCQVVDLPFWLGFFGGEIPQKATTTEGHRNTQKLLLVALGKELFQTNQGPSLGLANDGRYVLISM